MAQMDRTIRENDLDGVYLSVIFINDKDGLAEGAEPLFHCFQELLEMFSVFTCNDCMHNCLAVAFVVYNRQSVQWHTVLVDPIRAIHQQHATICSC